MSGSEGWWRLCPSPLRRHLEGRHLLQRVLANVGWLFADRALRMGGGVIIGVFIARYLGPALFGELSYAIAFAALFSPLGTLGLDGIVVRDLVRSPERTKETLGTALALKLVGGTTALALAVIAGSGLGLANEAARPLVVVLAFIPLFQATDAIDLWFQASVQSRYSVLARNAAFVASAAVRIVLVHVRASLLAFAWATLLETVLAAVAMTVVYARTGHRLTGWRVTRARAVSLLREGWPLIFSGLAVIIYMRIDVIMLEAMASNAAAGLYSAAARVSEVWYFIPVAITSSVAPAIAHAKSVSATMYVARLQRLFRLLTVVSLSVALPLTFLARPLMVSLYGASYASAGPVLAVHIWASVFVSLGVAQSLWDVNEGLVRLSLMRTLLGAVTNIALNVYLIPRYRELGAAIATVLSYGVSAFALNAVSARTRPVLRLQLAALTLRTPSHLDP